MQMESLIKVIVTIACFLMFLSGCSANKANNADITSHAPGESSTGATTPTPHAAPENDTPTDGSMSPDPSNLKNNETQTPDTTLPTTGINTGLTDGTKVKLFVSGKEVHWAIIMGDEVLVPDYPYTFGQLKDADGENAEFWTLTLTSHGPKDYKEGVTIYNSLYTIELVEGEYSFTCNDETFTLTVPAQTIDDEIHLPLLALAEAINATVEWDADAQAIHFFYK